MFSILKFGGTSMGSQESINKIISILEKNKSRQIIVVSAMSGVTNLLLKLAVQAKNKKFNQKMFETIQNKHLKISNSDKIKNLLNELKVSLTSQNWICELNLDAYLDLITSFGERLSANLLVDLLLLKNKKAEFLDTRNFIKTDNNFGNAKVDYKLSKKLTNQKVKMCKSDFLVCTGFIARSLNGSTTTLGRGGSDYTAGLLGNFLEAKEIEIWTDVSGVFSTNPNLVKTAKVVNTLSYHEAFEVAYYGGKVLYPKTMEACVTKY
jgi:bifunctional aspartokinase / homoserine dehydrogenase 1